MPRPVTVKKLKLNSSMKDLQDLLELTPKKDILLIIGDWNAKIGSQEIPGLTGKFGLGMKVKHSEWSRANGNSFAKRTHWTYRLFFINYVVYTCLYINKFCQENALVITNTLFQQHKRRLYTWTSPDGQHEIRLIIFFAAKDGEALYSQQKQDQKLTMAQIMNSLLPNSDLN